MNERIPTANGVARATPQTNGAAAGAVGHRARSRHGRWGRLPTIRSIAVPRHPISSPDLAAGPPATGSPRRRVFAPSHAATVALVGLFILAIFAALYIARAFVLPLALAMHAAFLLSPAVRVLRRIRVPAPVGAAVVVLGLLVAVGAGVYALATPTATWMERFPESLRTVEQRIRHLRTPVEAIRQAAEEVEKIATAEPADQRTPVVQVKNHDVMNTVVSGTHTVLAGMGLAILALYGLLGWGNLLLRKLVRALPTLADKKRAVGIARETEHQVSRYLLTITLINASLGAVLGCGFWLLGVPNPALWAAMAFALNFLPYVGPLTGILVLSIVAVATSPSFTHALLVPALYLILHGVETNVVTPLVLIRRLTLNPLVMFFWLSLWFWLWGIPGALLAVPMLQTLKIFCENIPPLTPVGQFLGR
jgi:predicted PurR-regulated permease PerM